MLSNLPVLVDALVLSAVGMSVVFLFLACLVGLLSLMRFVKADDSFAKVSVRNQAHQTSSAGALTEQRKRAAAIAVAIHELEKPHQ